MFCDHSIAPRQCNFKDHRHKIRVIRSTCRILMLQQLSTSAIVQWHLLSSRFWPQPIATVYSITYITYQTYSAALHIEEALLLLRPLAYITLIIGALARYEFSHGRMSFRFSVVAAWNFPSSHWLQTRARAQVYDQFRLNFMAICSLSRRLVARFAHRLIPHCEHNRCIQAHRGVNHKIVINGSALIGC